MTHMLFCHAFGVRSLGQLKVRNYSDGSTIDNQWLA